VPMKRSMQVSATSRHLTPITSCRGPRLTHRFNWITHAVSAAAAIPRCSVETYARWCARRVRTCPRQGTAVSGVTSSLRAPENNPMSCAHKHVSDASPKHGSVRLRSLSALRPWLFRRDLKAWPQFARWNELRSTSDVEHADVAKYL